VGSKGNYAIPDTDNVFGADRMTASMTFGALARMPKMMSRFLQNVHTAKYVSVSVDDVIQFAGTRPAQEMKH
jgi:hypothetical protein